MNFEEMIFDYVDGTLDSTSETKLFEALTNNDELRSELRQQLAIRNAVSSDMKAFTPKAESTLNIFRTLDIEPLPAPAPVPVPSPGIFSAIGSAIGKFSQGIIGGLISAAATAVIMFYLVGNHSDNNLASTAGHAGNSYPVVSSESIKPELPETAANGIVNTPNEKVKVVYRDRVVYKELPNSAVNMQIDQSNVNSKDVNPENSTTDQNTSSYNAIMQPAPIVVAVPQRNFASRDMIINPNTQVMSNPRSANFEHNSIELTGASYGYGMDTRVNGSKSLQDNFAIAYYYHFSNQIAIGMMYRKEQFHQLYKGTENGKIYEYEQNPTLNNAFLTLRYSPEFITFYDVTPFAELSAGFNLDGYGYIPRASIGSELNFFQNFPIIVGVEWDMFKYSNQNLSFYDYKYGLYAGFGYKF